MAILPTAKWVTKRLIEYGCYSLQYARNAGRIYHTSSFCLIVTFFRFVDMCFNWVHVPLFLWMYGQRGVNVGSTWGQRGVNVGSTWGQRGVNVGSTWGQRGVNVGSTWGQRGVNVGSRLLIYSVHYCLTFVRAILKTTQIYSVAKNVFSAIAFGQFREKWNQRA